MDARSFDHAIVCAKKIQWGNESGGGLGFRIARSIAIAGSAIGSARCRARRLSGFSCRAGMQRAGQPRKDTKNGFCGPRPAGRGRNFARIELGCGLAGRQTREVDFHLHQSAVLR